MSDKASERPRCNGCVHYYITHDAVFRYGCRSLDFKSRRQPVVDVIESSGEMCLYFRRKEIDPPR